MVLQCGGYNFRMLTSLISHHSVLILSYPLLLLTIKLGCIWDTLYDPLQPWLRLALHSFGLV